MFVGPVISTLTRTSWLCHHGSHIFYCERNYNQWCRHIWFLENHIYYICLLSNPYWFVPGWDWMSSSRLLVEFHWIDHPKNSQNFVEKAHYPYATPLKISRTHSIPAWGIVFSDLSWSARFGIYWASKLSVRCSNRYSECFSASTQIFEINFECCV